MKVSKVWEDKKLLILLGSHFVSES